MTVAEQHSCVWSLAWSLGLSAQGITILGMWRDDAYM